MYRDSYDLNEVIMKLFFVLIFNFFIIQSSIAETRDTIRDGEIKKNLTFSPQKKENNLNQDNTNQNLGLFKVKSNSLTGINLKNNFKYKLVEKLFCTSTDGFWQMIPKFKEIKWRIDFNNEKYEAGSTQSDETGLISLYFTAPNEITNQNIQFELNHTKITSSLGKGNHIYYFTPEACKKTKKSEKQN